MSIIIIHYHYLKLRGPQTDCYGVQSQHQGSKSYIGAIHKSPFSGFTLVDANNTYYTQKWSKTNYALADNQLHSPYWPPMKKLISPLCFTSLKVFCGGWSSS